MLMDDPGPAIFEADPADEFRLSFVVTSVLEARGRRTLMTMRNFEEDKMRAAIVWLGERQHLWRQWMQFAEDHDGATLAAHLMDLRAIDSLTRLGSADYLFEACSGASVSCVRETEIELSVELSTRTLLITTHAFATEDLRNALMTSIFEDEKLVSPVDLAEVALLRGRRALRDRLDAIAAQASYPTHTVH